MGAQGLLRFTTAGSVDDGKSTLIGRLLHDTHGAYEDQVAAVRKSSVNRSTGPLDFSLLTDGLKAEREQGITIDVAYRYFSTGARKFIIADTPGHEQYTRNMATGASTADLAVILIDARNGVSPQSKRHACIASLLGIPTVVVAVNKMDLVGYEAGVFNRIRDEFDAHLEKLGISGAAYIPLSALEGDNVVARSLRMNWYAGGSLLEYLEQVPLRSQSAEGPVRFPVQYVLRPDQNFRGYAGEVVRGALTVGQPVMVLPSGRVTRVKAIPTYNGNLNEARPFTPVAVQLEHEVDVSRGDMLVDPRHTPHVARRFQAQLVWMHPDALKLGRPYLLKHTTQLVTATVTRLRHRLDVETLAKEPADGLELNEIGLAELEASRPLFFDGYSTSRRLGSFILIDALSNATVAAGMMEEPEGSNSQPGNGAGLLDLEFRASRVTQAERIARAGHSPAVVWLTGRRELAYLLEARLFSLNCQTHVLAGDSETSMLPELAQVLSAAGMITIVSAAAGDSGERERARELAGEAVFIEVPAEALAPSDDAALVQICTRLGKLNVVPALADFSAGEGI
jgi:sulfate adenylyltransferase large subunit